MGSSGDRDPGRTRFVWPRGEGIGSPPSSDSPGSPLARLSAEMSSLVAPGALSEPGAGAIESVRLSRV